jgi:hypothetical protein
MTRVTVRRGLSVLFIAATIVASLPVGRGIAAVAGTPVRVALPEGTVLDGRVRPVTSVDGTIGFVAPALGDTIVAFEVRTGAVLGSLTTRGGALGLSLDEGGSRRLLAVTHGAEPESGLPATVTVVDATLPTSLAVVSVFSLPEKTMIAPMARAEFVRGQKYCVVPVLGSVDALVSFDVESGTQSGALVLEGRLDRIAVFDGGGAAHVAAVSSAANEVVVASVGEYGEMLPTSTFGLPEGTRLADFNNVAFDAAGRLAYVAAFEGGALFSFSVETGDVVDRVETGGSPARLAVYHLATGDRVAVVNVSASAADGAEKREASEGPAAVFVEADEEGKLTLVARFSPKANDVFVPANNPDFSADGGVAFVPAHSGALYETIGRADLDRGVESLASAPLAAAVVVASVDEHVGRLDVVPVAVGVRNPEGDDSDDEATPGIDRLSPASALVGRQRDLEVTVVGSGFSAGAVVLAGAGEYTASVREKGKRAVFTLPASALAVAGPIGVKVRNPDATFSNEAVFTVANRFTPALVSVKPEEIASGSGSVKLQLEGDHFRKEATVTVAYTDDAGQPKTETIKSIRQSQTAIEAVLPRRLTLKAKDLSLTVDNGDGGGASGPATVKVYGPVAESLTPTNAVAGQKKMLVVRVKGRNFHRDVRVYVKSPRRNDDEVSDFREVDRARITRRNSRKLVVRIPSSAYRYSGKLVLRIVNPVPGPAKGDETVSELAIEGPVVEAVKPEVLFARADPFVLHLGGKRFRPGANVVLKRESDTGAPWVRVGRGYLRPKSDGQLNVLIDGGKLLPLFARPGTLAIRIVNPNGAKGDPSTKKVVEIVGPELDEYDLFPSDADPQLYKLVLTGTFFREGVVVRLRSADGEPLGDYREVERKSSTKLLLLLKRSRVQELRNFKVVAVNPGGVASNALDVTLR